MATIVGTRPELIKLSRVIGELDRTTDHVLIHTGQNYDFELNGVFFEDLGIREPDHFLDAAGERPAQTIGRVIAASDEVLAQEKVDALLILGDTNSCLSAIAAKRRRIPIFHMEAGNRCFDQRVPEEINRRIVDHISDINLTYSEHARRNLLAEGLDPARVMKTGSPLTEVLAHHREGILASDVVERLQLESGRYFVVSSHREENVDVPQRLRSLVEVLEALARLHEMPVIVSTHPRTRKRLGELGLDQGRSDRLRFLPPLGFHDYVRLQQCSYCVLSDSGSLTEEASVLGLPAIALRDAHERPEGMDEATVVMAGLHPDRILQAVELVTGQHRRESVRLHPVTDYGADNVSAKVVRIILSYVDYVQAVVWRQGPGSGDRA